MAASHETGPLFRSGSTNAIQAAIGSPVGDPNQDAGPDGVYQGQGFIDARYWFPKDQVTGYTGTVAAHFSENVMRSISQIPATLAANNIAAAQAPTSATALTLAAASVGVTVNVPIIPFSMGGIANGTVTTAALALDFGFGFGNCTSGSTTIVVSDSNLFKMGMPLVIGGVGNSGGTAPLLTNVASITDTTHIVVLNAPLATNTTAPIGTGNIWGPRPSSSTSMFVTPTAALPFLGKGPGVWLDARQAIARNVRVVGVSGGTGGTVTVAGWDIYGVPMTETITLGAGANTVYGAKAFKYIGSVTPNFTDGSHNITVGTGDVFGFHYRAGIWEETSVSWAGTAMTSSTGYTAPLALITTATATTADVRGTIQTGTAGAGTGVGTTASNGTISSLAMTGNRLFMASAIGTYAATFATPADARTVFGQTQA